jgi:nucleoside-diphosphate-sugar epimerase
MCLTAPMMRSALVQNRIGSAVKAKEEIGFSYKYSLVDGLSKLIEWRNKTMKTKTLA